MNKNLLRAKSKWHAELLRSGGREPISEGQGRNIFLTQKTETYYP